jgi:hypothetical protein
MAEIINLHKSMVENVKIRCHLEDLVIADTNFMFLDIIHRLVFI